jgi:hypothetical protein
LIRAELQMLLNAEKHFASPVELPRDTGVRMKGRFDGTAEFGQVFEHGDVIGVIRRKRALIGEGAAAEELFRVTHARNFHPAGLHACAAIAPD